jgi:class 3 adenylate cyclase
MRVFADASGRITDAASRLFHLYVHEALRAQGKSGPELLADTHAISEPLRGILEPAVVYFHRKAWERAVREDLLLHLAEAVSEAPAVPGQLVRAILFTDLSGFTPLTEAMGDTAASRVVDRFSELVRDAVARNHGQILKQIGDEFMVVFAAARSAVECALDVERAATAEPNFPALRSGVHVGPVLYREADYVGANVNLAARVAGQAQGHQLLGTDAVREEVGEIPDVTITFVGRRELKGMPAPVDLFSVELAEPQPQRFADPVCGMELDPDRAAAEVTWAGRRYWFCSPRCLPRFAEAPEKYAPA